MTAAADTFRLRPLPTPFDPPTSATTTLATPSCCCCCCCIATIASSATFHARDGLLKAREAGENVGWATTVGFFVPFAGIGFGLLGTGASDDAEVWLAMLLATVGLVGFGLISQVVAGCALRESWAQALLIGVMTVIAALVEFFLVIATFAVIWLFTPLFMWAAFRAASRNNGIPSQPHRSAP